MPRSLAVLAVVVCAAAAAGSQVNLDALGPRVGDKAIAFELPDQSGRPRTLASVAGPRGTMLVFFRSADW
jgi:cytochrome oxidase Cu insertion factor (SCO1/SenC/PrrC family)